MQLAVAPVRARDLGAAGNGALFHAESAAARGRIRAARRRQNGRARDLGVAAVNARLTPGELERAAPLARPTRLLLTEAVEKLGLSARGYHRAWRLARTLADLSSEESVGDGAVAEALMLRELDRRPTS